MGFLFCSHITLLLPKKVTLTIRKVRKTIREEFDFNLFLSFFKNLEILQEILLTDHEYYIKDAHLSLGGI